MLKPVPQYGPLLGASKTPLRYRACHAVTFSPLATWQGRRILPKAMATHEALLVGAWEAKDIDGTGKVPMDHTDYGMGEPMH